MSELLLPVDEAFAYFPLLTTGLKFGLTGGVIRNSSDALVTIRVSQVTLTDDIVNYVERTVDGVVSANTSGFTDDAVPLWLVTTQNGVITLVQDCRGLGAVTAEGGTGSGGAGAEEVSTVLTTASLATDAAENGTLALGKLGVFLVIDSDSDAWIRFYATAAHRTSDQARLITADPTTPILFEAVVTGGTPHSVAPLAGYSNQDEPRTDTIYYRVVQKEVATGVIVATIKHSRIEA